MRKFRNKTTGKLFIFSDGCDKKTLEQFEKDRNYEEFIEL
jgi:hypothetical protein